MIKMRSLSRHLAGAAVAAALVFGFASKDAHAVPVDTELMLLIDGSGSISNADFELQRDAYVNVLGSLLPADGRVTVGVWVFGGDVAQVFAATNIASAADKQDLIDAIDALTASGPGARGGVNTGSTNIDAAIDTALAALTGLGNLADATIRQLIDVSTDGAGNVGDEDAAAAAAVAAGVEQVNCLGVGGSADCGFIAGTGAFSILADDFTEFEEALTIKIQQEVRVPEPVTIALFGVGLLGLGLARRRRMR